MSAADFHVGEQLDTAVSARILAQQARADEILGLLKARLRHPFLTSDSMSGPRR